MQKCTTPVVRALGICASSGENLVLTTRMVKLSRRYGTIYGITLTPYIADQIRRMDLVKEGRGLHDTITELTTAREFLSHRFFDSVYKDRDRILADGAQ